MNATLGRTSSVAGPMLALALLCAACNSSPATSQQPDRFRFAEADEAVVLHYGATNLMIRAEQPVAELSVYGSGRVVSRMPTRKETEWFLERRDLVALLEQLESTGALDLTNEAIASVHEGVASKDGGGQWAQDGAHVRLRVHLSAYRAAGEVVAAPLDLDLAYQSPRFYAEANPEVAELQSLAAAVAILEQLITDRTKRWHS